MAINAVFLKKALSWAQQFPVYCCLQSNGYKDRYSAFEGLLAVGVHVQLESHENSFEKLKEFYEAHKTWMFGFLNYDLKNETEALNTHKPDPLSFPQLYFFIPQHLILIKDEKPEVMIGDQGVLQEIISFPVDDKYTSGITGIPLELHQRISREDYLQKIGKLKEHIKRGDIYEVNFCQEFYAENTVIDPLSLFNSLNGISPTPFAGFFKIYDRYILSASPERYLCKRGNHIISQPIKGTAKRSPDPQLDEVLKKNLEADPKERAENVMIVDLVRNDLTKSAVRGTVQVNELFGIYSFPQVHQMISTISCELSPDVHFTDAIKNSFPMGSMTGAPKIRAMELIEQYETERRGAYSGSIGWISPVGDFDLNVIIRSILYNAEKQYLSFQVGGAITSASDPKAEYAEGMLKASAIMETLRQNPAPQTLNPKPQ